MEGYTSIGRLAARGFRWLILLVFASVALVGAYSTADLKILGEAPSWLRENPIVALVVTGLAIGAIYLSWTGRGLGQMLRPAEDDIQAFVVNLLVRQFERGSEDLTPRVPPAE
jgi:hypothetical protein